MIICKECSRYGDCPFPKFEPCIFFDFGIELEHALKNTVVEHSWGSGERETEAVIKDVLGEGNNR